MEALKKQLPMQVVGTALLTFQGAENGIDAAKDPAPGSGVAPESIHARMPGLCTIRTPGAEPKPKDVSESQAHQDFETMGAGQGVAC